MAGEHLLVVDDEDNLRSMLCAALRHHGFEISAATNGREALTAIARSPEGTRTVSGGPLVRPG